ncbi:MAG: hypothetical protein GX058_06085 [Firmicutes bacterium]|nr:hypothetical protein [Bacillota bacterium]
MSQILSAMYGNLVETTFRDIEQTTDQDIVKLLADGSTPLPIIKMNGHVRFSGHLFIPLIIKEIDAILEQQVDETTS